MKPQWKVEQERLETELQKVRTKIFKLRQKEPLTGAQCNKLEKLLDREDNILEDLYGDDAYAFESGEAPL